MKRALPALVLCAGLCAAAPAPTIEIPGPAHPPSARLARRVTIEDGGDPERRRLLERALGLLESTPTGAQLCERLLRDGPDVVLSFQKLSGGFNELGGVGVDGFVGTTWPEAEGARVAVNEGILQADKKTVFLEGEIAEVLAHELSHALEHWAARKAGIPRAFLLYREDETNAAVAGWLAAAELGLLDDLTSGRAYWYLVDPAEYHRRNILLNALYAVDLSREDMLRPVQALEERLAYLRSHGPPAGVRRSEMTEAIGHFLQVHEMHGTRLDEMVAEMVQFIDRDAIVAALEKKIAELRSDPALGAELKKAAGLPMLAALERSLETNSAALKRKLPSRVHDLLSIPPPPQETARWQDFLDDVRQDKAARPDHWDRGNPLHRAWEAEALEPEKAVRLALPLAKRGSADAQYLLGSIYSPIVADTMSDPDKGYYWTRLAARQGLLPAMHHLASLTYDGAGTRKDPAEAARLHRLAAEGGFADSMLMLAVMTEHGIGVPADAGEAFEWYRRCADLGNQVCIGSLGRLYWAGLGTSRDPAKAVECFRRAAGSDHDSLFALGKAYEEGVGVSQDYGIAALWYGAAALRSSTAEAMERLGRLYERGLGVDRSLAQAWKWLSLASQNGRAAVGPDIKRLESSMSGTELSEARRLLEEFRSRKAR